MLLLILLFLLSYYCYNGNNNNNDLQAIIRGVSVVVGSIVLTRTIALAEKDCKTLVIVIIINNECNEYYFNLCRVRNSFSAVSRKTSPTSSEERLLLKLLLLLEELLYGFLFIF